MDKTSIEAMEMVKDSNLDSFEALTKNKGRLNISKNNPKKFTFGTIVEDPAEFSSDSEYEYTFCVFRVGIGKSFCHKMTNEASDFENIENIAPRDGYDSVYLEYTGAEKKIF